MTTAAVELIGAVCKRLSWSQYLYYVKHFVHILQTGLTEQKLAVRYTLCAIVCLCRLLNIFLFKTSMLCCCSLLVTVLEAFHFDHQTLSKEVEAAKNRMTG